MDKRAKRRHIKELKRKKIRNNIRLNGKYTPPEIDNGPSFGELAKKAGFGPLKK